MSSTNNNKHVGLLFQVEFSFQGHAFRCLFSREADTEKQVVRYQAVVLNEDKVSIEDFINMFLTSIGVGTIPSLPVQLPPLDSIMVVHEENGRTGEKTNTVPKTVTDKQTEGLTRIHINLSIGNEKQSLGSLDFIIKNKKLAFLLGIALPIRFAGIPLAENVFQEQDGISQITIVWLQGTKTGDSPFGISFVVTIGDWKQTFRFGCLEKQTENGNTKNIKGLEKKEKQGEDAPKPLEQDKIDAENAAIMLLEEKGQTQAVENQNNVQKMEKKKGPFAIRQIGVEFQTPEGGELKVFLKFSVLLSFSVLDMQMMGLKLGLPVKNLTSFKPEDLKNLEFDMEGLAVDFQNHGLMISGALRKQNASYSGVIRVKYKNFELSAVGAYEKLQDGSHSLFIWLLVRYPIGGPPAFFITGLAGGFGLNRRLKIPAIDQVKNFPLVAMAQGNAGSSKSTALGAGEVLDLLSSYIEPENGSYFIAVGVEFTTFELLKTFALGIVTFGTDLEVHLLGITTLSMPPGTGRPLVYAELLLKASILPSKGVLSLEGQLTNESYLFDSRCKLTGGFAMYLWFGENAHAGDFVVTIGGYHPRFQAPSHYPVVDRIKISWMILPQLTLEGSAYFALTPTGIMAGGNLSILYQWGDLSAWLIANADFLMQWAPLHYDISVQVCVGVSYTFRIFGFRKTLQVELGASLHLYGPEFAGEVQVSWFVISFTIRFGQRNNVMPRLSWIEFKSKFLNNAQNFRVLAGMKTEDEDAKDKRQKTVEKSEKDIPQLDGKKLVLFLQSKIPMTEVTVGTKKKTMPVGARTEFGVLPMGENSRLKNHMEITIDSLEEGSYTPYPAELACDLKTESVAPALWGLYTPPMNATQLLSGAVTSVEIRLLQTELKPYYYSESKLKKNEKISHDVGMLQPHYHNKTEHSGKNLANKLEEWKREYQMETSEQLKTFENQQDQVIDALATMFPLWGKEKLSGDICQRRESIFLVESTVRTFS